MNNPMNKRFFKTIFGVFLLATGHSSPATAAADVRPLQVVTTMSAFADIAKTIGGEHVEVAFLASPKFNPHFIEPKPSDVLRVKRAELFIHAGLDLEAWRGPLLDAAGNRSVMPGGDRELDLSKGIALLEVPGGPVSRAQGDIHLYGNPHYWVDPQNGALIAQAIAAKLGQADPDHAGEYDSRLRTFTQQLGERIAGWRKRLKPFAGTELVGDHNAWPYLMRFADMKMEQFLEPKPGIPPTPRQVEAISRYVQAKQIRGLVTSAYFPNNSANALAKRTGIKVVTLAQNVGENQQASDYIKLVEYNVSQLLSVLGGDNPNG